ncbi:MAG: phosphatidylinositol-specific phospholipase C/glycerophosphodiester phosphodiesterase family protein [Candidatus Hydrogenedentes bacterium]|nr:phosphatidylinositol-specific phospholipase C/glycerophosphodiester phosphodiesterase family protein [Candidatus Hydrogenedentota bacterium]
MLARIIMLACSVIAAAADTAPLPNAHAHNDYEHARPLLDALDHGFCSIEADVYLVNSQLLVAHDREDIKPDRTLQSLYLDPLQKRVRANGGRVYKDGPTIWLFIDIKDDGPTTYAALRPLLEQYADMLTVFEDGRVKQNAVTIVLSGDAPKNILITESKRYAAIDGRLPDLDAPLDPALIPVISDSWPATFRWNRAGDMPADVRDKLRATCEKAHASGAIIRFWGIPHREDFWAALLDAGVDLINADDLPRLSNFLHKRN